MATMFVSRYPGSRFRPGIGLGQGGPWYYPPGTKNPYLEPPSKPPSDDIERVIEPAEIVASLWPTGENPRITVEEAKSLYSFVLFSKVVRTKAAFLAEFGKMVTSNPGFFGQLNQTENGRTFVASLAASTGFFERMTLPNISATLTYVLDVLESSILARFKIGVLGRVPIYRAGSNTLDYSDVRNVRPADSEVMDFGDLSKTPLSSDIDAMLLAAKNMNVPVQLGALPAAFFVFLGITVKWLVIGTVITVSMHKIVNTLKNTGAPSVSEVSEAVKNLPPDLQKAAIEKYTQSKGFLEETTNLLKWGAVVGIVIVGGIIAINFAT